MQRFSQSIFFQNLMTHVIKTSMRLTLLFKFSPRFKVYFPLNTMSVHIESRDKTKQYSLAHIKKTYIEFVEMFLLKKESKVDI